jgi:predicted nucleic acid-binding protein
MSGDFFDSNVIVYQFDPTDLRKREAAVELVNQAVRNRTGCVSFQVVQEVLNVITTKLNPPADARSAREFLDEVLVPLWQVLPSQELYQRALEVQARYRYRFYDSLLIAAALECGCDRLLSEDLQHGQRIEQLTIENPFAAV